MRRRKPRDRRVSITESAWDTLNTLTAFSGEARHQLLERIIRSEHSRMLGCLAIQDREDRYRDAHMERLLDEITGPIESDEDLPIIDNARGAE